MRGSRVHIAVNGDRLDAHVAAGADDATCDLPTVCNEDFGEFLAGGDGIRSSASASSEPRLPT